MNKPVKHVNCPLCKNVKLMRDKRKVSLFVCPKCGLHISPNRRKARKERPAELWQFNQAINADLL